MIEQVTIDEQACLINIAKKWIGKPKDWSLILVLMAIYFAE